jgi:hypothetical protein
VRGVIELTFALLIAALKDSYHRDTPGRLLTQPANFFGAL